MRVAMKVSDIPPNATYAAIVLNFLGIVGGVVLVLTVGRWKPAEPEMYWVQEVVNLAGYVGAVCAVVFMTVLSIIVHSLICLVHKH